MLHEDLLCLLFSQAWHHIASVSTVYQCLPLGRSNHSPYSKKLALMNFCWLYCLIQFVLLGKICYDVSVVLSLQRWIHNLILRSRLLLWVRKIRLCIHRWRGRTTGTSDRIYSQKNKLDATGLYNTFNNNSSEFFFVVSDTSARKKYLLISPSSLLWFWFQFRDVSDISWSHLHGLFQSSCFC